MSVKERFDYRTTKGNFNFQRQIAEALAEPVAQIIDTIKALEQAAELSADIVERGIMLTGEVHF